MRIVIAGSTGFIGSALVPELREHGHEVRRLVRRAPRADDEFRWDPPAGSISSDALDGADAVVNLCGSSLQGRWSDARKQKMRDSRIEPTEVLAEAVAERGIPALLNSSGIGFYGNTGDVAVDETAGEGAGFLAELVADWEAATAPAREAGARVVLLRNGPVLSPEGGLLRLVKPIFKLGLGGKLGDGRQWLPWISMPDEVAAIRFLIANPGVSGPVNMCAPHPVTNAAYTKSLAKALGRPSFAFVPKAALKIAFGEAADETALVSQRAFPHVLRDAGFRFRHTDIDAALADVL